MDIPTCVDCGHRLPVVMGRSSQHVNCLHCDAAFVVVFSDPFSFRLHRAARKIDRTFGIESMPGTDINAPDKLSASFETKLTPEGRALFESLCVNKARQARIRVEVEAMDWPEVIGE